MLAEENVFACQMVFITSKPESFHLQKLLFQTLQAQIKVRWALSTWQLSTTGSVGGERKNKEKKDL